jgi:hypothetical protein
VIAVHPTDVGVMLPSTLAEHFLPAGIDTHTFVLTNEYDPTVHLSMDAHFSELAPISCEPLERAVH